MTNLEVLPREEVCPPAHEVPGAGPCLQLWPAREVPLGGVRAMKVSRTLPQRGLPTVGAWCFLDSFGPERVAMSVLPHPHTGLQTVTWPLLGTIRHRDSVGSDVLVRPGELNIMTAGRGVSHSEFAVLPDRSPRERVSLPGSCRCSAGCSSGWRSRSANGTGRRPLNSTATCRGSREGFAATVMVGSFAGGTSPATMYTPIVGVDVRCSGRVAAAQPGL